MKQSDTMDAKQLVDALTSHISLYNSCLPQATPNPNPNPRSQILKWFSSLSISNRQSHLTILSHSFAKILLQMVLKLRSNGPGLFIVLPDLPSEGQIPTLCYRRSHGLVLRVSETDEAVRAVREAVRLFSSREGEGAEGCACSLDFIDSVTVCPGFVENVDAFVDIMDRISNGRFLKGEESGLGEEWVELDWLKAKGYYGIEAFVANWLEVALRFSWMNFNGGKKRGVKLKEKLNVAGVAANVYWRKKGCVDWWVKLDAATRRNVYSIVLGKGAKPLVMFGFLRSFSSTVNFAFATKSKLGLKVN